MMHRAYAIKKNKKCWQGKFGLFTQPEFSKFSNKHAATRAAACHNFLSAD